MIRRYVDGDALGAIEEMLLVPVPADSTEIQEGFAGKVIRKFPQANMRLRAVGGLPVGQMMLVGRMAGDHGWTPSYSLVLAAIHEREQHGWEDAPLHLKGVLNVLSDRFGDQNRLATAGIPGTGFSGLRGGAEPDAIRGVLDQSIVPVSVYYDESAGDREPRHAVLPVLSDAVTVD